MRYGVSIIDLSSAAKNRQHPCYTSAFFFPFRLSAHVFSLDRSTRSAECRCPTATTRLSMYCVRSSKSSSLVARTQIDAIRETNMIHLRKGGIYRGNARAFRFYPPLHASTSLTPCVEMTSPGSCAFAS